MSLLAAELLCKFCSPRCRSFVPSCVLSVSLNNSFGRKLKRLVSSAQELRRREEVEANLRMKLVLITPDLLLSHHESGMFRPDAGLQVHCPLV